MKKIDNNLNINHEQVIDESYFSSSGDPVPWPLNKFFKDARMDEFGLISNTKYELNFKTDMQWFGENFSKMNCASIDHRGYLLIYNTSNKRFNELWNGESKRRNSTTERGPYNTSCKISYE